MNLKSAARFSNEVEGRLYTFTMAANAPVGEAYDVLFDWPGLLNIAGGSAVVFTLTA